MAVTDTIIDLLRAVFDGTSSINVKTQGNLNPVTFDYVAITYPSATQEVYTYKSGGSGGTTASTITVNYSDSSKRQISNVTRV